MDRRPDVAPPGTVATKALELEELIALRARLKFSRLFVGATSKFAPVTETGVPGVPIVGVKLVIPGMLELVTLKVVLLVADPLGLVTAMGPVVAPLGTLTTICVSLDEITVAVVPLNITAFWLAVALNPVPEMVTEVPTGPLCGVKPATATVAETNLEIERRLPTASYE
jgi:hypothetical protein